MKERGEPRVYVIRCQKNRRLVTQHTEDVAMTVIIIVDVTILLELTRLEMVIDYV